MRRALTSTAIFLLMHYIFVILLSAHKQTLDGAMTQVRTPSFVFIS